MTAHGMQVQQSDWTGDSGERWVRNQQWLDRMLAPFGHAALLASRVVVGERVIDVGCGAGTTSLALAEAVGSRGEVLGVDVSEALLASARTAALGFSQLSFLCADAGTAPLQAASYDLLFSRFGVMFFEQPAAAFSHLRAALKPSGRLSFVCWRSAAENDWVRLPAQAVRDLLPESPALPPDAPGPFAFAETAKVRALLEAAGFAEVRFEPLDHSILYGSGGTADEALDQAQAMALELGPLARRLAGSPEPLRLQAMAAVRAAFTKKLQGDEVRVDGAAWLVTARQRG